MNVEWYNVKAFINKELTACQRQLQTCPHDEIDLVRGRIQAFNKILRMEDTEVPDFMKAPNVSSM